MKNHYKTIVLSDIHLGTSGSKAKEVINFLKHHTCDRLILNGDIIDGWQLKKSGKWQKEHTRFFKRILKIIEGYDTEVIYLRGNHDDFLDHIIPFSIGNIVIKRDHVIESNGNSFYVIHGDIFDSITTNLRWIAKLGDVGYTFLLWINQIYNKYRLSRGLPYYSLSQKIKAKVKSAVSYISDFETQLAIIARLKKCNGIICGHIHQPAIKQLGDIIYMNSGDWVETMSALVEDNRGQWELLFYNDMKQERELIEDEDLEETTEHVDISTRHDLFEGNDQISKKRGVLLIRIQRKNFNDLFIVTSHLRYNQPLSLRHVDSNPMILLWKKNLQNICSSFKAKAEAILHRLYLLVIL